MTRELIAMSKAKMFDPVGVTVHIDVGERPPTVKFLIVGNPLASIPEGQGSALIVPL